jgi:hypothetical protein
MHLAVEVRKVPMSGGMEVKPMIMAVKMKRRHRHLKKKKKKNIDIHLITFVRVPPGLVVTDAIPKPSTIMSTQQRRKPAFQPSASQLPLKLPARQ